MRWEDHMRANEEAMIGRSTTSRVDEVLSEGRTRFEDEVRSARRDAEAVRLCNWKNRPRLKSFYKIGLATWRWCHGFQECRER